MRLLLDTHIYLWCVQDNTQHLSKAVKTLIQDASEVYVSSVSIWEAVIKSQLGKLDVDINALEKAIASSGFIELSLTAKHAVTLSQLPNLHRDPFDRILVAQAISEPLKFLTADKMLQEYSDLVTLI